MKPNCLITWSDIDVSIQAIPQRAAMVERLRTQIAECGPATVIMQQPGQVCTDNVIAAFAHIAACGKKWGLRFEDDCQPCPDFPRHALDLIRTLPEESNLHLATFYNGSRVNPDQPPTLPAIWDIRAGSRFMMTQCILVSPVFAQLIVDRYRQWLTDNPRHPNGWDTCMGALMKEKRWRYAAAWPALTQHRVSKSKPGYLNHGFNTNRLSPSYQAVFGDCDA